MTDLRETSFDADWRFFCGDATGAEAPGFDDRMWRAVDLPHDWRIEDLPGPLSTDGRATADPSLYRYLSPEVDPTVPRRIGPFDVDADPAVDLDAVVQPFGRIVVPGGRGQAYTVSGVGWYRKRFRSPAAAREQVELRFDGVFQNATVWLNGTRLGFNANGYISFAFDLTPHLRPGADNVIAVRVDNSGKTSRWYTGSGIYRHTWLTVTGPVRVPRWGVSITTPQVDTARSTVRVELKVESRLATALAAVRVSLLDAAGRAVIRRDLPAQSLAAGASVGYAVDLPVERPALWSPEAPNLYRARCEVLVGGRVVDAVDTKFGIRSLVWDGQGLHLNGRKYVIVGGNVHHDHGPIGAIAIDRAEERTIEVMKAAGFNSIRGAHNPISPYMLDVCDRLGMLVYEEFSDLWDKAKTKDDYSNHFVEHWRDDLAGMVLRDRNHPSIILWSIGNEILEDPNDYGPILAEHVRSLDRTRPVALGGINIGVRSRDALTYVDIADYHYQAPPADNPLLADKATVQSENSSSGIHDDWKLTQTNPAFVGSWTWVAWDFIGEAGVGAPVLIRDPRETMDATLAGVAGKIAYPWYVGACGDIDLIGQRKPQNYWRSVVMGRSPLEVMVERPVPEGTRQIAAMFSYFDELESWTWDVAPGKQMTVRAYTSGDNITVLLNGKAIATQAVTEADQCRVAVDVPYEPGTLVVVASKGGQEIARKALVTSGKPAALRLTSDVPALTTARGDLAHVLVEVLDAEGRLVPDAVVEVSVTADGAGELLGMASANPHNVDSYQRGRRWTWHGQALAVLRPAKQRGLLTVTASADGLKPARVALEVRAAR
ncbi:MAG: DUF4982 domain-containing protein [Chitinophagaceae bacterium]|nr:DUF4982 domain-containing protein [Chitinophagaceae bacterium]